MLRHEFDLPLLRSYTNVNNVAESRTETKPLTLQATTNSQGDYSISGVNPGMYIVSVELQGFLRFENCRVALRNLS